MVNINLLGSVYVAKYSSIHMARNTPDANGERGLILFVSSIAAEDGMRSQIGYSATKAAINGLVLPMARDLGRYGIRATAIAPGFFVNTPNGRLIPPEILKRLLKATPLNRSGDNLEFAMFCKTVIENSYLNGVRLRLDGGVRVPHM